MKNYKSAVFQTDKYKKANPLQQDFLYLNDLCEQSFPDINNVLPPQKRQRIVDSLSLLLSNQQVDQQTFNGYMRFYLSKFKNQHTNIVGLESKNIFPFLLFFNKNGWYLWDINTNYDSLLIGKRITKFNNTSIEEVEAQLSHFVFAENDINYKNQINPLCNRPDLLKQFNVIEQTDSLLLSFADGERVWVKSVFEDKDVHFHLAEKRSVHNSVTKYINHNYNIALHQNENYAYFQFNRCNDKIDTYENMSEYLKPWIIPFAKMYLQHQIKKKNGDKIKGYVDVDRPIFKDYLQVMFDSIQKQNIQNLVIDLRNNPGGSSLLCLQLAYHLSERNNLKDFSKMYNPSIFQRHTNRKKYQDFLKKHGMKNEQAIVNDILYPDGFLNGDSLLFEQIEDSKSPYYIPKNRTVFRGKVIILANYGTGSAAALLTTLLQDNGIAVVIGTSVGNNPIGATEFNPYKLPNSKFTGSLASGYLIRPNPAKGKIQVPDYWIENNVEDLIQGKDKYLEKAIKLFILQNNP